MAIVRRTSKAAHDLVDVGKFVAAHDLRAAERLLHRIDATCRLLSGQPELGTLREDLAPNLRFFCCWQLPDFLPPNCRRNRSDQGAAWSARDFRGQLE